MDKEKLIKRGDKVTVLFGTYGPDGIDDCIKGTLLSEPGDMIIVEGAIGIYYCYQFQAILKRRTDG